MFATQSHPVPLLACSRLFPSISHNSIGTGRMKAGAKTQLLFFMLVFSLCILGADQLRAQNTRMLHSFQVGEGIFPTGLALSGNTFYGTASMGGSSNDGTIFSLSKDGTALRVLYSFNSAHLGTVCVSSNNLLYGMAATSGTSNNEVVFVLSTDGTGFRNLSFVPLESPTGLVISGNTLYGTAEGGGSGGVVFKLNTDGTGFTNLYTFTEARPNSSGVSTNTDAAGPNYLILSGHSRRTSVEFDFIGQHIVRNDGGWLRRYRRTGQSLIPAAAQHKSLLFPCYFVVAYRLRALRLCDLHPPIHDKRRLGGLGDQSSIARGRRRPLHRHQPALGHTAVFPAEPAIIKG